VELLNFGVELVKHGAKRVWQRIGGRNQPNPVRPEDPKIELRVEEGDFEAVAGGGIRPRRLIRSAIVLRPSTLLRLHRALTARKYRLLFSTKGRRKPGPKGPSQEVVAAVVDMKRRNPTWGCPRIAQPISLAFGLPINKDIVRRILAVRYQPRPDAAGPSWLTVLGHAKDSLWSLDLFRCESAVLRTHWVLVVMDQCTRRIVGFGVLHGVVDGLGLCRMFNQATRCHTPPTYVSSDHDPLYRFHQWQRNLRILDVQEIKAVPYVPLSHPFVKRLIGTIRRECLDRTLFWTTADLEAKLLDFPSARSSSDLSRCGSSVFNLLMRVAVTVAGSERAVTSTASAGPAAFRLTGWLDRRERQAIAYLMEENRILPRRLSQKRLQFTNADRRRRNQILGRHRYRHIVLEVLGAAHEPHEGEGAVRQGRRATRSRGSARAL
jgi:hypothetical protein